jgi:hypothetical protein
MNLSRDELWNLLNRKVFNMVADDLISEEEGECILDLGQESDDLGIVQLLDKIRSDSVLN